MSNFLFHVLIKITFKVKNNIQINIYLFLKYYLQTY